MNEMWRPIPGYENYLVSTCGRVYNQKPGRKPKMLRPSSGKNGYQIVIVYKHSRPKGFQVHRLVLEAFGPPCPSDGHQCNHKDLDKTNNRLSNLEWVTRQENMRHWKGNRQ